MNAAIQAPPPHNNPDEVKYPLRQRGDLWRFYKYLFFLPIFITLLVQIISGYLLFPEATFAHFSRVIALHTLILGLFFCLLWIPILLTVLDWPDRIENSLIYLRSILLLVLALRIFPHCLLENFLGITDATRYLYWLFWIGIALLYLWLTRRKLHYTAFRDIRTGADPRQRRYSERWVWYETMSFFILLLSLVVMELWCLAYLGNENSFFQPAQLFIKEGSIAPDTVTQMKMLAWFCSSSISGLVFFLTACLGNRLIGRILIPVTFHERDVRGVIQKTYRYLWHFVRAMLLKQPFLLVGGFAITVIFLSTPIVFVAVKQHELLADFTQADQIILALVVFVAWFSPLTLAAVHPDETFGEYFNQRLADLLMVVQGHLVVIGFGSLGKRVLEREVRLMLQVAQPDKSFLEVVTPDLRLEKLSSYAVVIERDPQDVIFSGENSLLGRYGVVSTCHKRYKTRDPNKNVVYDETRVLVPVIIGEAREPFISSRVNLERARLIISTVPDEGSVQSIFDRANQAHVSAIICVSRSDQISYLTYRARHRRIVLVYPKHNQGTTLGHRLWAAMVKVRSIFKMPPEEWPKVMIVGNNKATQFMLETLWIYLPGDPANKTRILKENFAFIITASEHPTGYPILKEKDNREAFDLHWPALLVTSSRFPYQSGTPVDIKEFTQQSRLVNEADQNAIQACIEVHRPHILVLNHDEVDKSPLLLSRCVRALERLKSHHRDQFYLPLILLTAVRGDERERQVLGDASRYYDALGKMYKEPLAMDTSYPSPARYAYYAREVIGESISDALADAEEVIAGARRSFSVPIGRRGSGKNTGEKEKQFVEISTCLPNRPGALANFLARMAGIGFDPPDKATIEALWEKGKAGLTTAESPHMPSFQYLRNIILDPEGKGDALTGYALLVPIPDDSPIYQPPAPETSSVVRIYVNDGRNYLETDIDPDELYDQKDRDQLVEKMKHIEKPAPPGVPNVIDRLTRREAGKANTIGQFREVLLDPENQGKYACPGMSLCRVAAFQDYVAASNYRRLARQAEMGSQPSREPLRNTPNYYCCPGIKPTREEEKPAAESCYARVFCCAYGEVNDPGMIAMVLNTLIFRPPLFHAAPEADSDNNWVINIDYFKDVACQNSYFAMNRVFGYIQEKQTQKQRPPELPLHLIRILPIGGINSARLWFTYARALYHFLDQGPGKDSFRFYWLDAQHDQHPGVDNLPTFREDDHTSSPIVIVIKRIADEKAVRDPNKCKICGLKERAFDCGKLRVWV